MNLLLLFSRRNSPIYSVLHFLSRFIILLIGCLPIIALAVDTKGYEPPLNTGQTLSSTAFDSTANVKSSQLKLNITEQRWLREHPEVIVSGFGDWAPIEFVDEGGNYRGFSKEYLQQLARIIGIKFNYRVQDWPQSLADSAAAKVDMIATVSPSNARRGFLFFSDPIVEFPYYFFQRSDVQTAALDKDSSLSVAVPKDFLHDDVLKRYYPRLSRLEVDNPQQAFDAVLSGKADLLFDIYPVLSYIKLKAQPSLVKPLRPAREVTPLSLHIGVVKNIPL